MSVDIAPIDVDLWKKNPVTLWFFKFLKAGEEACFKQLFAVGCNNSLKSDEKLSRIEFLCGSIDNFQRIINITADDLRDFSLIKW